MIAKLKLEIQELKNQLALVSGDQSTADLSQEELERLQERVQEFVEDQDPESQLNVGADMRKINECFRILKVNKTKHLLNNHIVGISFILIFMSLFHKILHEFVIVLLAIDNTALYSHH